MKCKQCIRLGILQIAKHRSHHSLKKKKINDKYRVFIFYIQKKPPQYSKNNMTEKFCIHKYWISLILGSTGSYMSTFLKCDGAHIS